MSGGYLVSYFEDMPEFLLGHFLILGHFMESEEHGRACVYHLQAACHWSEVLFIFNPIRVLVSYENWGEKR